MYTENTSFSTKLPKLQLFWDSTSLSALKKCPRSYELSIIEGWSAQQTSHHLTFGIVYHSAIERYDHAKVLGKTHDECTLVAVRYALEATWDKTTGRPWVSGDTSKNRYTLVRTIVWYLEQFKNDPLRTLVLQNGKPAVEVSFKFQTDLTPRNGDHPFFFCGHLDRVAENNGQNFIVDKKTTTSTLTEWYFNTYTPDNQMSFYNFSGKVILGAPLAGTIVDAAQVAVGFSRFERRMIPRTEAFLMEWYKDTAFYLSLAEHFAEKNYWPMNDKACFNCDFRKICAKSPSLREGWLPENFTKRTWDPLIARGDV